VLLDTLHAPGIAARQFDRRWEFAALDGIVYGLIADTKECFKVLGHQEPK
jgi:hypothetical protein